MKTAVIILSVAVSICGIAITLNKVVPKSVYLTNEQIIVETKMCEDRGLTARVYPYYSVNVKKITCIPSVKKDASGRQDIKKSNIMNVTLEK